MEKFKKPENFIDMLNLQKHLDKSIHSARPRTLVDIGVSLIAELIEFNEETPQSHKTWKTKPYNKSKELEEFTDIWFFLAQLVNYGSENNHINKYFLESFNNIFINTEVEKIDKEVINKMNVLDVITLLLNADNFEECVVAAIQSLLKLGYRYGYTKDDILNCYWEKWQKNMQRIGKEWN